MNQQSINPLQYAQAQQTFQQSSSQPGGVYPQPFQQPGGDQPKGPYSQYGLQFPTQNPGTQSTQDYTQQQQYHNYFAPQSFGTGLTQPSQQNQYQQQTSGSPGYGYTQINPSNFIQTRSGYQQAQAYSQVAGTMQMPNDPKLLATGNLMGFKAQQPTTGFQQPAAGFQQPAAGFQQPAAGFQQPAAGHQQPAASFQQPVAGFQPGFQPGFQQPAAGFQQHPSTHQQYPTDLQQASFQQAGYQQNFLKQQDNTQTAAFGSVSQQSEKYYQQGSAGNMIAGTNSFVEIYNALININFLDEFIKLLSQCTDHPGKALFKNINQLKMDLNPQIDSYPGFTSAPQLVSDNGISAYMIPTHQASITENIISPYMSANPQKPSTNDNVIAPYMTSNVQPAKSDKIIPVTPFMMANYQQTPTNNFPPPFWNKNSEEHKADIGNDYEMNQYLPENEEDTQRYTKLKKKREQLEGILEDLNSFL